METFLHRNGQQLGPYSLAALRSMYEQGELQSTDIVWDEESQLWRSVSEFFQHAPPMLPPVIASRLPPQVQSENDTVFFSSGLLVVTKTRFVVGPQTFALSGITSVRAAMFPPDTLGRVLLIVIGVTFALVSLGFFLNLSASNWATTLGTGFLFALIAAALFWGAVQHKKAQKNTYAVILRTAGGEVMAYQSQDGDLMMLLTAALNQAIVARG